METLSKFFFVFAIIILLNVGMPVIALGCFSIPLKEGNHTLWIERLDLHNAIDDDNENYAENFYFALVEAIDPDSDTPYLVNVASAPHYVNEDMDYYYIPITTFSGTYEEIKSSLDIAYIYSRAVYEAFERDHPEACWLARKTRIIVMHDDDTNITELQLVLFEKVSTTPNESPFNIMQKCYSTTESIQTAIKEREECIQKILATITGSSRYEQIRQINTWLIQNNSYCSGDPDSLLPDNIAPYGCLSALKGSSGKEGPLCEGYARAFKVLCDRLYIPCVLVSGCAIDSNGEGGEHMWNSVQMEDGAWYGVDITWNIPDDSANHDLISEDFLLVGSQTSINGIPFGQSHPVSNQVSNGPTTTSFTNGPKISLEKYQPNL